MTYGVCIKEYRWAIYMAPKFHCYLNTENYLISILVLMLYYWLAHVEQFLSHLHNLSYVVHANFLAMDPNFTFFLHLLYCYCTWDSIVEHAMHVHWSGHNDNCQKNLILFLYRKKQGLLLICSVFTVSTFYTAIKMSICSNKCIVYMLVFTLKPTSKIYTHNTIKSFLQASIDM